MKINIITSKKLDKLQSQHLDVLHVVEDLSKDDWQLLYRRLGHFIGNELTVKLDVDTYHRLGEEDYIPYAILIVDGKDVLYVVTSFDVYSYKEIMKTEERTSAFMLGNSKILRSFCQEMLGNNNDNLNWYNIELNEHIERELNYQTKNNIEVPFTDPSLS